MIFPLILLRINFEDILEILQNQALILTDSFQKTVDALKKTSKLCSKMLNNKIKVFNHQACFDEIDSEDIENLKEFEIKFQKLLEFKTECEIVKFNCMLHVPKRHTIHQEQTEGKQIKNAIFIF